MIVAFHLLPVVRTIARTREVAPLVSPFMLSLYWNCPSVVYINIHCARTGSGLKRMEYVWTRNLLKSLYDEVVAKVIWFVLLL